jgi:hypothetical protein
VPGGQFRAAGGVEQDEQAVGTGDPGEFAEPGFGIGQLLTMRASSTSLPATGAARRDRSILSPRSPMARLCPASASQAA